jgi:allantoate deiminase
MNAAQKVMRRIDALAKISDEPGKITRTFASPAMRRANEQVGVWMREAGLETRVDAIGNLRGHRAGESPSGKILLLGSHLDSVRNAGRFDGPLGVLLAIACVEELRRRKIALPFALAVIGFADEEGVRYQTTYLGSKAVAGCFDPRDLKRKDADGISMAEAIRNFGGDPAQIKSARLQAKQLIGYVEAHIEQGPVLEKNRLAAGIVTGIAGQSRACVIFTGRAGHAGTVPMSLRQDALCAAAEFILAVEQLARKSPGLVATVGEILVQPGASNVIPGEVRLTLDVRHAKDAARRKACDRLRRAALAIGRRRAVKVSLESVHEAAAVTCSPAFSAQLAAALKAEQKKILYLPSGAGHDAAVMARITPVAMLFVRCKGGISHHPDESVTVKDIGVALRVLCDFISRLAKNHEHV